MRKNIGSPLERWLSLLSVEMDVAAYQCVSRRDESRRAKHALSVQLQHAVNQVRSALHSFLTSALSLSHTRAGHPHSDYQLLGEVNNYRATNGVVGGAARRFF